MLRETIFKKRFDDFYPMLCRIAFSYIPDIKECEDIVQESFIAVWNNQKDKLEEKEFAAYMVRAVRNNCVSFLRKQTLQVVSFEDHFTATESLDVEDEEKATPHYEEILEQVLSVLPPKCKEVFLMSKLQGLKYKEIAERLQISEKTVENQMGKAIKLIRQQVQSGKFVFFVILVFLLIKEGNNVG